MYHLIPIITTQRHSSATILQLPVRHRQDYQDILDLSLDQDGK